MKKIICLLTIACLLVSCAMNKEEKKYLFYIGTYTDGSSEGIYQSVLNGDGTFDSVRLAAEMENPSFLAFAHEKSVLLAVSEVDIEGTGTLDSYEITEKGLSHVATSLSGGAHPCHLSVNTNGDVLMANYSGGNIGYVKVNENAVLSDLLDVAQHEGASVTERQTAPHAHSIWYLDETNAVAVDLGIDQLIFYQVKGQQLHRSDSLSIEGGSGPRHLNIHPNGNILYVINELNSTVSVVAKEDGKWIVVSTVSTLPDGFEGESYCADIHLSPDAKFLYASNRGHNSLAVYQLEADGIGLRLVSHESVKGNWPRNFAITPDGQYLVVANQHSNNLVCFKRDADSGLLTFVSEVNVGSPVCVLIGR